MKKILSLVLALALCAGLAVPALAAEFSDVPPDHAFYDAIMDCSEKGIVGGYSDGTFKPANTVTKSNFAVMLSRAFYPGDVAKYNDDAYNREIYGPFAGNYLAAYYNGAFEGASFYEDFVMLRLDVMGTEINRYDMAQLMANIMKNKGFTVSDSEKTAAQARIADYSAIPDQYKDAVAAVYALGIIGGFSDGTFGGEVTMNRGQAAVVIYRLAQYVGDGVGAGPEASADTNPATGPEDPAGPGSGETAPNTPADPGQSKPETPVTPTGRTLANGKAITEDNVTEILNQLKETYPRKTDFAKGYAGLGSGRTPSKNCIDSITRQYYVHNATSTHPSTTFGCGGWAAYVADEIFGQTGVTWKKTSIANARPGDLMIQLDSAGYAMHVSIYVSESTDGFPKTMEVYNTSAGPNSSGVYKINWINTNSPSTYAIDVYTAYPD